jgi:tetratricopeptide (TPR) repeat protein
MRKAVMSGVRSWMYILFFSGIAAAQEELALVMRAVSDYERVNLSSRPELKDAIACVQSQAALLPAVRPDQQYLAHFRRGICELVAARLRDSRSEYLDAASDFEQAIAKWPAATPSGDVVTASVRVALTLARLWASGSEADLANVARDLEAVEKRTHCPGTLLMTSSECERYVGLARQWLGWIRFQQGRLHDAADLFAPFPSSHWRQRAAGLRALEGRLYAEAARWLEQAMAASGGAGVLGVLAPAPDKARTVYELALARYLAGDASAALKAAEAAVKDNPKNAQALFLRGRAHESLGNAKQALADYELASRTAFANVDVQYESGHAHYYRGVALFRRKDFGRAESAFTSALNFEPAEASKPDVTAWRHMAAVAQGSCQGSANELADAIGRTSPLFPSNEARELLRGCRLRSELPSASPDLTR